MHRARTIVSAISGPPGQKFGSWLIKNSPVFACTQCRDYSVPAAAEPFLNGSSSQYVEDMYNAWLADPSSVHAVSLNCCQYVLNNKYSSSMLVLRVFL